MTVSPYQSFILKKPAELSEYVQKVPYSTLEWIKDVSSPLLYLIQHAAFGVMTNMYGTFVCTYRIFTYDYRKEVGLIDIHSYVVPKDDPMEEYKGESLIQLRLLEKRSEEKKFYLYQGHKPYFTPHNVVVLPENILSNRLKEIEYLTALASQHKNPLKHVIHHWIVLFANALTLTLSWKRAIPTLIVMNGMFAMMRIWAERLAQRRQFEEAVTAVGSEGAQTYLAYNIARRLAIQNLSIDKIPKEYHASYDWIQSHSTFLGNDTDPLKIPETVLLQWALCPRQ
jgi:hypothetical protein